MIEAEGLLGLALIAGLAPKIARGSAILMFGSFAAYSLIQAVTGVKSCGCLGVLALDPWIVVLFDLAAVAALVLVRPSRRVEAALGDRFSVQGLGAMPLVASVILFIGFGASVTAFGSPIAAFAWLQGNRLTVEPTVMDLGEVEAGPQRTVSFRVTNHGERPVTLVGGTSTCNCTATEGLPIDIPPGGSRSVPVKVSFTGRGGTYKQTVTWYGDDWRTMRAVQVRLVAHMKP